MGGSVATKFFPGTRIGCIALVKRLHGAVWRARCDCGRIIKHLNASTAVARNKILGVRNGGPRCASCASILLLKAPKCRCCGTLDPKRFGFGRTNGKSECHRCARSRQRYGACQANHETPFDRKKRAYAAGRKG